MGFLTFGLAEKCTVWVLTGVDGYNKEQFSAPQTRDCRWEERTTLVPGPEGQQVMAYSRVFLAETVKIGDFMARGIVSGSDPREVRGARAILDYRETPALDASDFERKAYL